jgi:hypothetical protein
MDSTISNSEAPPSYDTTVSQPAILSPGNSPQPEEPGEEDDIPDYDPPPFTLSPITLTLAPTSILITPPTSPRTLYQLTRPLTGHTRTTSLAEILPSSKINSDGTLQNMRDRQILYKIYEHMAIPRNPRATAVSAQHKKLIQGTVLKQGHAFGSGAVWEARARGEDRMSENTLLFSAKRQKGVVEWKDAKGTLVAVEMPAVDRGEESEILEVLVPLEKKMMDMIVAVWVARVHQVTEIEGKKEEMAEAKTRKQEKRAQDAAEGKPHGKMHDCEF